MSSEGLSYAAAGVDIEAYERALERVKPLIAATHGKEVAVGVGPFAGLYALPGGGHLAASADGVGTKIKVAIAAGKHRGIGVDIVNHCVNDIATAGARPLFFLDYFATGQLDVAVPRGRVVLWIFHRGSVGFRKVTEVVRNFFRRSKTGGGKTRPTSVLGF